MYTVHLEYMISQINPLTSQKLKLKPQNQNKLNRKMKCFEDIMCQFTGWKVNMQLMQVY